MLTEHPELRFATGSRLLFGPNELSLSPVEVNQARQHKQGYLLKLSSVDDRNRAEEVRGWGLYIPADEAAPTDGESFYHHQMIGMKVVDRELGELGTVVAVVETPAHDLLEIRRKGQKSFFLPLIDEFVGGVDLEAGVIETGIPADLMEL